MARLELIDVIFVHRCHAPGGRFALLISLVVAVLMMGAGASTALADSRSRDRHDERDGRHQTAAPDRDAGQGQGQGQGRRPEQERYQRDRGQRISHEQAVGLVQRQTGGRVLSSGPIRRNGSSGYQVRVLVDGARVKNVFVDDQGRMRPQE